MARRTIEIGGMSCSHCVASVKNALTGVEGVQVEEVRVGEAKLSVDDSLTPEGLAAAVAAATGAVRSAGYQVLATTAG